MPTPNETRQLKQAAHLTAAFMGSNILSSYAGAAEAHTNPTKTHIYTAASLAFCAYGIWQTVNPLGSDQTTPPTNPDRCTPPSTTETYNSAASPNVKDRPGTQPTVTDHMTKAFTFARRLTNLAVSNLSTTAGTVLIVLLTALGVFA